MSQVTDIRLAQEKLEESFSRRMTELEAQLQAGGPSKDTVAKVAEEFRTFRELIFSMLGLLRQQITECCRSIDVMETRHRRKALIFLGTPETEKEDCRAIVLETVAGMNLPSVTSSHIVACHRLGTANKKHHRPILVWFSDVASRTAVWRLKTKLKGTSTSIREFLTQSRQTVFAKARQLFGMRSCWTQDGAIIVRTSDGNRHKIVTTEELCTLVKRYKVPSVSSSVKTDSAGNTGVTLVHSKQRK